MPVPIVCGLCWFEHYKTNVRLIRAASLLAVSLLVWLWSQRVILLFRFNC
jgi:hypothetical protein